MTESPIIHRNIGDGKLRRFFLSFDELTVVKREVGRGWYSLYNKWSVDAEPEEVCTIIRLALIGGGEDPVKASEIAQYYCSPPRPLKNVYLLAYECLNAVWNGTEPSGETRAISVEEMDNYFAEIEALLVKNNMDPGVLKGKSFAEIQKIMSVLADKPTIEAPSAEVYLDIKNSLQMKGD